MSKLTITFFLTVLLGAVTVGCATGGSKTSGQAELAKRTVSKVNSSSSFTSSEALDKRGVGAARPLAGILTVPNDRVIYFDYDSDVVSAQFGRALEENAKYILSTKGARIRLEGHADERGSREYNLALGERRAVGVKRRLGLLGVQPDQISVVSYGEERPAAEGHDVESYQINRRVEIVY